MKKRSNKIVDQQPPKSQVNFNAEHSQFLNTTQKMQLSEDLVGILQRLQYTLPNIQSILLNNLKNMTPLMYWFLFDSFNYPRNIFTEYKTIVRYRAPISSQITENHSNGTHEKMKSLSSVSGELIKDKLTEQSQFIMELKQWVSEYKGTLNIQDINETSIDQLIEISEGNLEAITFQNDKELNYVLQQAIQQRQKEQQFLQKHDGQSRRAHPMFIFDQIQDRISENWFEKSRLQKNMPKCYICSQGRELLQCQTCKLKVHQKCYPPLWKPEKKNSKKKNIPDQKILSFQCENCIHSIDTQNEICELCCCPGGYFLKTQKIPREEEEIIMDNSVNILGSKLSSAHLQFKSIKKTVVKQNHIHLSCFIWNQQIEWNKYHKQAIIEGRIDKKKLSSLCSFCGISYGSAVACTNDTCRRFYHPQCAKRCNLQMNYYKAKTSVMQLFCERHKHLHNYEAIQEAHEVKLRQAKKLFELIDKELKRQNFPAQQSIVKIYWQSDCCTACKKGEMISPISICGKCEQWYHQKCSNYCRKCL